MCGVTYPILRDTPSDGKDRLIMAKRPNAQPQPLGTCLNCTFWCHQTGSIGQCRRNPPPQSHDTQETYWCGEWSKNTRYSPGKEKMLRELIPFDVQEKAPWLFDRMPFDFDRFSDGHKMGWPYAYHAYIFLQDLKEYGPILSLLRSMIHYVDNRYGIFKRKYRPVAHYQTVFQQKCRWITENLHLIFPTLIDRDEAIGIIDNKDMKPPEDEDETCVILPKSEPLHRRKDIFSKRERDALYNAGISSWEDLEDSDYSFFAHQPNIGQKTVASIMKKARQHGHTIWRGLKL